MISLVLDFFFSTVSLEHGHSFHSTSTIMEHQHVHIWLTLCLAKWHGVGAQIDAA